MTDSPFGVKSAGDELRRVLRLLPAEDQQKIRACWEKWSNGGPVVYLMSKRDLKRRDIQWAATTGAIFYFREELFSLELAVPIAVLDAVLAHELAHSASALEDFWTRCIGTLRLWSTRIGPENLLSQAVRRTQDYIQAGIEKDLSEGRAWIKTDSWGFDQKNAVEWLQKHLP